MKHTNIPAVVIIALSLPVAVSVAFAAQDNYALKSPNAVLGKGSTAVTRAGVQCRFCLTNHDSPIANQGPSGVL
jgi:hypothetical protein